MPIFKGGIILAQLKEPAFSKPILRFVNPQTDNVKIDVRRIAAQNESEAIIEIARRAKIVDGRDGRLLHKKLEKAFNRAHIVIADAVDDEPYVSSKIAALLQLRDDVTDGLDLCCRVAGCKKSTIMVYKMITDIKSHIPRRINKVKVTRLRGGYPVDHDSRFRGFGSGHKLVVGAPTLVHLSRAVYEKKSQSTVFVTVAGNCVSNPVNLEVSIGMTVMQVLERCGLSADPTRIVCGGPMTGYAIIDPDNTLVTFTTNAIIAVRENERDKLYTCIGCGRCEQVCPAGLNPMYIQKFVSSSYFANLENFDAHLCTGCGTCSYICPSKLEVSQSVLKAKEYAQGHFVIVEEDDEP